MFTAVVWPRLEGPLAEIVVHVAVTVLAILGITIVDGLLRVVGIDGRYIDGTGITLSDWMFDLEVIASTVIIGVGIIKALKSAWSEP
jgi:hypothetical protein